MRGLITATFSVLFTISTLADSVSLFAVADNTLYANNVDYSNGAGQHIFAGITGDTTARRGLLRFDVASAIPAGSTITSATLTLHMSQTPAGAQPVSLHTVTTSWGEAGSLAGSGEGSGAPAQSGDATWKYRYFNDTTWTNLGGDFNPLVSASISVGGIGFYAWNSAQMSVDVQSWLDSPGGNFGWLLQGNESGFPTAKRFDSRENSEPTFRPVLIVNYVPEPATITFMIGFFALSLGRTARG